MNERLFFPQPPDPRNKGGIPTIIKVEKLDTTAELLAKYHKEGLQVVAPFPQAKSSLIFVTVLYLILYYT